MRPDFFILCKSSSIDQTTNSLSIFNIINELTLTKGDEEEEVESLKYKVQGIVHLTREEADGDGLIEKNFRMVIIDPDETEIEIGKDLPIRFEENHKRFRLRVTFELTLQEEGVYKPTIINEAGEKMCSTDLVLTIK